MNNFTLKNKFLVITLIAWFIIGVLVYYFTLTQVQKYLLLGEKNTTQAQVQKSAASSFNLELPLSLKAQGDINHFIQDVERTTKTTNIKIYDPNGNAVFSPVKSEISQNFSDQAEIKEAISGKLTASAINQDYSKLTLYIPIKSAGGDVRGVISANLALNENYQYAKRFALQLDGLIGLISIIFVFTIYFVFSSDEADMIERDHSLVDRSKAFEEEKQLDDAIMSSIAESLIVINKDGQIMIFNPEAERLTGYRANEVEFRLYRKILNFYDKEGKDIAINPVTETLKTAEPNQVAIKDGYFIKNLQEELVPVAVSVAPILDREKNIQGVAATIQDVSAEKDLDAIKDEFVYVVAHELGNPIFALDGYLSILQDHGGNYDKTTKEIINSARSVNTQLSNLVNDLLEVTRNEQGTLQCELTSMDITLIVKQVLENAAFKAHDKKITLNYKKQRIPTVLGNSQKVKEVLTNLIDNAIKYSPERGNVWVSHDFDGGNLITRVRDNGFGISKVDQENLFTKFYRVKTTKTKDITGTGLGLFICRQIIEKCGGKLWVDSEENNGSTFSFSLKISNKTK